jgi:gluconolactonase
VNLRAYPGRERVAAQKSAPENPSRRVTQREKLLRDLYHWLRKSISRNIRGYAMSDRPGGLSRLALITLIAAAALPLHAAEPVVLVSGVGFPEGTVFIDTTLYFVDYNTSEVLRLAEGKVQKVWQQDGCGANGLLPVPGGLLVACYANGTVAKIGLDGRLLETIQKDDAGQALTGPNDLAADAKGGVYFSASGSSRVPGKVFYRGADRSLREVAADIAYSNGLVVSLDGSKLYVNESETGRILVFDVASNGSLSDRRVFSRLGDVLGSAPSAKLTPDGLRLDKRGNLFVGLFDGGGFAVIAPDAKLIKKVDVPGAHHANLAISPDGRFIAITSLGDGAGSTGQVLLVANPVAD